MTMSAIVHPRTGGLRTALQETFTINDSCAVLGQGRSKLYGLIRSGALETIRIGARQYIRRTDLERIIERGLSTANDVADAKSACKPLADTTSTAAAPFTPRSKATSSLATAPRRGRPRKSATTELLGGSHVKRP